MKIMKSLLLGSAAGLVALSGAQAADLPVKAKAVEYVKICSAYGAGFYYIPGTDICLRVGGYVRADYYIHARGATPFIVPSTLGSELQYTRDDNSMTFRARATMIMDARTNTAYGTLRSYIAAGVTYDTDRLGQGTTPAIATTAAQNVNQINYTAYMERAFIQFAGFTFGYTQSFYDTNPSLLYFGSVANSGQWTSLLAYTANFGGGWTATLSLEDPTRRRGDIALDDENAIGKAQSICADGTTVTASKGSLPLRGNCQGGVYVPDIVANARVDQGWGSFQVSGALHEIRVGTLTTAAGFGETYYPGHPNHAWGGAVGAGVTIKTPSIGAKDTLEIYGNWTKGAVEYTGFSMSAQSTASAIGWRRANGIGATINTYDAWLNDTNDGYQKSTAWSAGTQFRHYWTPMLRSVIAFGYFDFKSPNSKSKLETPWQDQYNNGHVYQVGANTIWSPVKDLDLGVEVMYSNISSGSRAGVCTALDACNSVGVISGMFRAQRNF